MRLPFLLSITIASSLSLGVHHLPSVNPLDEKNDSTAPVRNESNGRDIQRLEKLINDLAIEHIPHEYARKKGWGNQKDRWDGLHIQLKDFKLKTKRRKKLVNHGTWKAYSAELVDPENRLKFHLNSIRKNENGKVEISLSVVADLKLFGRLAEWFNGVQLFSISVDAKASVQLDVLAVLGTRLDFSNLPPDLFLDPEIKKANLSVKEFRIKRISKVGGEIAQQVGRGAREILDDKIEEYETKLVTKLNKSIAKKKDKLKLSISELVDSEWSRFEQYLIPENEESVDKSK